MATFFYFDICPRPAPGWNVCQFELRITYNDKVRLTYVRFFMLRIGVKRVAAINLISPLQRGLGPLLLWLLTVKMVKYL